jgi:hypothetical protein
MENLNQSIPPLSLKKEKVRLCPVCKQEVLIKPGMHNWKKLFRRPSIEEMITLFIILGVIAIYFTYQNDIKQYEDYISKNCNPNSNSLNIPINPREVNITSLNIPINPREVNITNINVNKTIQKSFRV